MAGIVARIENKSESENPVDQRKRNQPRGLPARLWKSKVRSFPAMARFKTSLLYYFTDIPVILKYMSVLSIL